MKTAVVMCYVAGGDYDKDYVEYVNRLAAGVREHTTSTPDIYCITSADISSCPGVVALPPKSDAARWHVRNSLFYPSLFTAYDRVLYIDLDTIITGPIEDILQEPSEFMVINDVLAPSKQKQYGIFSFNPHLPWIADGRMWDAICKADLRPGHSSAAVFNEFLATVGHVPTIAQDKYRIASYKGDICGKRRSAANFQVICYHGLPRPHTTNWATTPFKVVPTAVPRGAVKRQENRMPPPRATSVQFETVEPIWRGEDVFIIGGGPSLRYVDLDRILAGQKVIAVNDAYLFDCATILFFGDASWFKVHGPHLANFGRPMYSTCGVGQYGIKKMLTIASEFGDYPSKLYWGGNSGDAAINLALLLGAQRVFLLGFDRCTQAGVTNWHKNIRKVADAVYRGYINKASKVIDGLAKNFPGREVINVEVAPGASAMGCFPKVLLTDVFAGLQQDDIYVKDKEAFDKRFDPTTR